MLSPSMTCFCYVFGILSLLSVVGARLHKGHAYLDVYIKLSPTEDICGDGIKCTLPYALSMLNSPNQFDLQSTMMQEGLLSYSKGRFNDSTVVRLSRQIKNYEGKLYLGLRLFDLPEGSQDYTIIDVTRVVDRGHKTKVEMITDAFTLSMKVSKDYEVIKDYPLSTFHAMQESPSASCSCQKNKCSCCAMMSVRKIRLQDSVCVNVSYLPDDIGVELSVSIAGFVVYDEELSVRNPPPVCFEVPHLREYASLCIRLIHLDATKQHLSGCVEVEAELYHVRVARANLGCFDLPVDS